MAVDLLGYFAGFCLLLMASMRSVFWMRVCNIAGNVTFVLYGFLASIWPVFFLNAIMIFLHLWRIYQARPTETTQPHA